MKPPKDAKIYDGELATFWFNEYGMLCAIAKSTPRTLQKQKENYSFIRRLTGNKKVYLLTDTTHASAQDKETRDYSAIEMGNIFKAMAVISESETGKFITNVFIALKDQPIPIVLFKSEADAKQWLLRLMQMEMETGLEPSNNNMAL